MRLTGLRVKARGQITMIVALGLVLLITVGLILFVMQPSGTPDKTIQQMTSKEELNAHVLSCLDSAVADELESFALSGGASVYGAMTSSDKRYFSVGEIGGEDVLYGVSRNRRDTGDLVPHKTVLPDYPAQGLTIQELKDGFYMSGESEKTKLLSFQEGYLGQTGFIPLCDKNGPNGPDSISLCKSYPGNPPGTPLVQSTQEILSLQVKNKMNLCVNTTLFGDYDIGDPKVDIVFSESAILANVTYEVRKAEYVGHATFSKRYPVRLQSIVQYAMELGRVMTRDPTFDPTDDVTQKKIAGFKDGFSVERMRVSGGLVAPDDYARTADLMTVKDEDSSLLGKPFTFRFLVERRLPILDTISANCGEIVCDAGSCKVSETLLNAISPDGLGFTMEKSPAAGAPCTVTVTDEDGGKDWQDITT